MIVYQPLDRKLMATHLLLGSF